MSAPIGWYDKKRIASNIFSYAVSKNYVRGSGSLYVATAHLRRPWRRNQPTQINLKLSSFDGNSVTTSNITGFELAPARTQFPIHLSIASYQNKILVGWQETKLGKRVGTRIRLIYSPNGHNNFSQVYDLDESRGKYTTILPRIITDELGKFHIFYQKEASGEKKFTMFHASGDGKSFSSVKEVVDDIEDIGRGAFFPSVIIKNNEIDIFYQNRLTNSLKDEIFHVRSGNNGRSFSSPNRITSNDYNDFSPFATSVEDEIEVVWQGRSNGIWSIYHSTGEEPKPLTKTSTNSYFPQIVYIPGFGRVVAWYDFRERPPQIYSVFLDKQDIDRVGKPHNVSLGRASAKQPKLVQWRGNGYLFYLSGRRLFMKQVDSDAGRILVSSETHPKGRPSRRSKGIFRLRTPRDPSGIQEIAWIRDNSPDSVPEIYNLSTLRSQIVLNNLKGGNHYLHFRYKDRVGNESKVTHYNFIVDTEKPDLPLITSSTHKEQVQSTRRNVTLHFQSKDDSAISYYQYTFSTNRAARLKNRTESESLSFNDLEPNIYFFKVRSVDLAGNASAVGGYRFEIIYPEDNVSLYTNLESQQLKEDFFVLEYLYPEPGTKLTKAYYVISKGKKNPYKNGEELALKDTPEGQRLAIPMMKYKKRRLYTISLGFHYANGQVGKAKSYSFEYMGAGVERETLVVQQKTSEPEPGAPDTKIREERVRRSERRPGSTSTRDTRAPKKRIGQGRGTNVQRSLIEAGISAKLLDVDNNLYEISFSMNPAHKEKLKGYSWHLAGKPEIPRLSEVNSQGGPEYVYQLSPGVYYLMVLPVFTTNLLNKRADYSYQRILVREKYFWEGNLRVYFLGLLGFLFLYAVYSQYRRIAFYINSLFR